MITGAYTATITKTVDGHVTRETVTGVLPNTSGTYGPKGFTPEANTFSQTKVTGRFESKYNFTSPGTYSWRFQVNEALCAGGDPASAVVNVYNNGGRVPGTHYAKSGVSPCYGFHAQFPGNTKINNKGNYQTSGGIGFTKGLTKIDIGFVFNFTINFV